VIEDTDMPLKMQIQAMASASEALDLYDVLDCTSIAAHIKKVTFFAIFSMIYNRKCSFQTRVFCWCLTEFMVYLSGRSLIPSTVLDGSVWWDQVLGAFSHIRREASSTLLWRLSISSSSKGLLNLSQYILMLASILKFHQGNVKNIARHVKYTQQLPIHSFLMFWRVLCSLIMMFFFFIIYIMISSCSSVLFFLLWIMTP